jgi:hypothetical protein
VHQPADAPPTTLDIAALAPAEVARRRAAAALVLVATASLLGVAWWLEPSKQGFGTHQALGLPACSWPARFGVPCPSCGMTTAFALAAKGRLVASFIAQPMGCLLALGAGMALVASAWTLLTGRTVLPVFERLWNARTAWILGVIALLAWGYKIAAMRGAG